MNSKMVLILCLAVMVTVLVGGAAVYVVFHHGSSPETTQMEALKELRDTGVITQQEYDVRAQAALAATSESPASPPAGAMQSSSPVSVVKAAAIGGTRKVEIGDPRYQTTAYTLDIPADWAFAGEISRPGGCHSTGAALRYTAQSPDGVKAIVLLPGVSWTWSTDSMMQKTMELTHCPGIDIDTAAKFLVNIAVPNIRPNAKILEVLPLLPEGQAKLKEQAAKAQEQNAAMARQYGQPPQKITADGARVRLQYQRDGHPVEEMIAAVIDCNESTTPALYQRPASQRRTCTSRGTTIMRASQGHLDEFISSPLTKQIGASLQPNPAWQSRLQADQQAAFQKWQAENNRQFQAMMKNSQEQNDALLARGRAFNEQLRQQTQSAIAADRQRQAAIDESAHQTALYSLDRQEFRNPNTGQIIEADSGYNHQWLSSDGSTLIQTDSHGFDPNGQVYPITQSWTELVPKK